MDQTASKSDSSHSNYGLISCDAIYCHRYVQNLQKICLIPLEVPTKPGTLRTLYTVLQIVKHFLSKNGIIKVSK